MNKAAQNILIVRCHPVETSLISSLSDHVEKTLRNTGHEIRVQDLYKQQFEPALSEKERKSYYAESFDAGEIEDEIAALCEAEVLILVFPTWWFGFPAKLKGWFDRVWAPGYAYDHAPDLSAMIPKLDKLQKVIAITSLGSPAWVDYLVLRRPVARILKRAIVGTCAPKAKFKMLSLYKAEDVSPERYQKFIQWINKELDRL